MKALIFTALCLFLVACANPRKDIAPEFQPAFDSFIAESIKYGRDQSHINNIIIERGDSADACGHLTAACCNKEMYLGVYKPLKITVERSVVFYSALQIELLIFHELGHCLLSKSHDDRIESGHYLSMMHSLTLNMDINFYKSHRDEYIQQLFSY